MRGFLGTVSVRQYLERYHAVVGRLAGASLSVRPGSRFDVYGQDLAAVAVGNPTTQSRRVIERALNATTELTQLLTVFGSLAERLTQAEVDRVCSGHVFSQRDENTDGRNIQFQYFMEATFYLCGIPAAGREPDFVITFEGRQVGVPVKRLCSEARLVRRVHDAAAQCRRAALQGIAVIDATRLLLKDDSYLEVPNDETGFALLENGLSDIAQRIRSRVPSPDALLGFVLYAAAPAIVGKREIAGLTYIMSGPFNGTSPDNRGFLNRLTDRLAEKLSVSAA